MAKEKKDMNEAMVIKPRVMLPHKIHKCKLNYYQIERILKIAHQFEESKKICQIVQNYIDDLN